MEDWEIKKAYQIVYEDLKEHCKQHARCSACPIKEACDQSNEMLHVIIKTVIESLYGKEENKNDE